eukprot:4596545-Pyramimonas_sp.AAC.1
MRPDKGLRCREKLNAIVAPRPGRPQGAGSAAGDVPKWRRRLQCVLHQCPPQPMCARERGVAPAFGAAGARPRRWRWPPVVA